MSYVYKGREADYKREWAKANPRTPTPEQRKRRNANKRKKRMANLEEAHEQDRKNYVKSLEKNPEGWMLERAKSRAKAKGLECTITASDIIIPPTCPVLGIPLFRAKETTDAPNSPSIDRIDPTKGYTKDNVWVISFRANSLKSDATLEEFDKMILAVNNVIQQGGMWYPSEPYVRRARGTGENPITSIMRNTRSHAKRRNVVFDIEHSDIVIPDVCPILGIPLFKAGGKPTPNSPSIDRIDPSKGYVKGNVWIVSWRANRIKKDGTVAEFRAIATAWRSKLEEMRLLKTG